MGTWKTDDVKKDDKTSEQTTTDTDKCAKIIAHIYTKKASESVDLIISQFHSAILECVYDYVSDENDKFFRIIRIVVNKNEAGNRLIDSLEWVNDIIVSED